jgi:hypothetical protein
MIPQGPRLTPAGLLVRRGASPDEHPMPTLAQSTGNPTIDASGGIGQTVSILSVAVFVLWILKRFLVRRGLR